MTELFSVKLIAFLLGAIVLTPMRSQAAPSVDFNEAAVVKLPYNPIDLEAADFNGDGRMDLAVTLGGVSSPGGVLILLNEGSGFGPSKFFAAAGAFDMAIGDLNGDGTPDLACVGDSNVSVLLALGDGGFAPARNYPTDADSVSIAVGDFNNDGAPDIISASRRVPKVIVLFNDGGGGFGGSTKIDVLEWSAAVAVVDLNADGNLDFVASSWLTNTLSIAFGNGDGTFQPAIRIDVPSASALVAAGDFNSDGKVDLAVLSSEWLDILTWQTNGTLGLIKRTANEARSSWDLKIGDIDGDGALDIAAVAYVNNAASVFLGNGDGGFRAAYYGIDHTPFGVAIGDWNADGRPDLATSHSLSRTLHLQLNRGGGDLAAPRYLPISTGSIILADFNSDDSLDMAQANDDTSSISVALGNGDGTFAERIDYPVGYFSSEIVAGDLNGDGHLDLIVALYAPPEEPLWTNRLSILMGLGNGAFTNAPGVILGGQVASIGLGDFNRDGKLDLVTSLYTDETTVFLGNGDGTFGLELQVTPPGKGYLAVGDFNNDGNLDLINGSEVFLGNGDGTFRWHTNFSIPYLTDVKIADFNLDGNLDLLAIGFRGAVSVRSGNGDGSFVEVWAEDVGAAYTAEIGDFNGDGWPDIAVAVPEAVVVLVSQADGTFSEDRFLGAPRRNETMALGDLNHDSSIDMMVGGFGGGVTFLNQTFTRLELSREPGRIAISWPGYTAGLRLESTDNLLTPNWQGVRSPLSVVGDRYVVTDTNELGNRFYRLRRQ